MPCFLFHRGEQLDNGFWPDSRSDAATFRQDLFNIARTTLSSKVLAQDKDYFANLAVDAVLRLKVHISNMIECCLNQRDIPSQGSTDLEHIQIIKKAGGKLTDSYLDEGKIISFRQDVYYRVLSLIPGFILDKTIAVNSPKRMEGVKILIANTCGRCFIILHNLQTDERTYSAMDTDKIKIFGARVKVDGTGKLAELERAEKVMLSLSTSTTSTF